MKESGDIDEGCIGKNAWDNAIRSLVSRILDLSMIGSEGKNTVVVEKLQDALDVEFEYVLVILSQRCFRNTIKRFMKTECSKLKAKYMEGDIACLVYVVLRQ